MKPRSPALALFGAALLFSDAAKAQSTPQPAVSGGVNKSPPPAAPAQPSAPPTMETLIGSMSGDELQQAIQLLKTNYINADSLNEGEMSRATLQGLLTRIGRGVMLLPAADAARKEASTPSYTEILDGHIGYVRIGSLTAVNLKTLDATLQTFPAKKVDAIVLDLRAGPATGDFEIAAEFAKRFCVKGKALFTLHKANARQERAFVSDRDPAFTGLVLVLADKDTSGEAEALAAVLRAQIKALIIGQPTAGRAVEYADLPLAGGKVLRVPVGEVVLTDRLPPSSGGIKPDLPVELVAADKRQIFQMSGEKGMASFVFENERPHLNEAALLAGKNPELEVMEAAQRRGRAQEKTVLRDFVLQRAVDVVTSLAVYQRR